ncbi:hypothetical protein PNQ92_12135 [Halobacterium salinarum]|uniref:hypothetical protein n=1 Tax=Halobacterium salinarum TaxID=2242 RepID=UPI002553DDE8|nr:hypothetical protein [Halobacterium salinarum]MDL0126154.1 hypothetical protein [Halobacterium salinarum]
MSDREIDTILNLLESDETLSGVFRRRMKRWEAVAEIAEDNDFKLNHAKEIFYE